MASADILRDLGKDAPAAETAPLNVSAPQPEKKRDVYTSLLEMNDAVLAANRTLLGTPEEAKARADEADQEAREATQFAEQRYQAVGRPLIGNVLEAAKPVSYESVPKPLPQPEIPSQQARPYLDMSQKNALSGAITGLSVMAQLAMAGKAPVAALAALTGAMEGWHTGDAERAQRDWRVYLAQVEKIKQENQDSMRLFEANMQVHGTNLTAAQAALVAGMYEAGHYAQAAHIARQGAVQSHQQLLDIMDANERVRESSMNFMQAQMANNFKEVMLQDARDRAAALDRHRTTMEAQGRERIALAERGLKLRTELGATATKAQNEISQIDLKRQELGHLEDAVSYAASKGALPKDPTVLGKTVRPWLNVQTAKGDEKLLKSLNDIDRWGTALVVSRELGLGQTASSMRIASIAKAEGGNMRSIPVTWWQDFFKDTHRTLDSRQKLNEQTLNIAGRTAAGFGMSLPEPAEATWGEPE